MGHFASLIRVKAWVRKSITYLYAERSDSEAQAESDKQSKSGYSITPDEGCGLDSSSTSNEYLHFNMQSDWELALEVAYEQRQRQRLQAIRFKPQQGFPASKPPETLGAAEIKQDNSTMAASQIRPPHDRPAASAKHTNHEHQQRQESPEDRRPGVQQRKLPVRLKANQNLRRTTSTEDSSASNAMSNKAKPSSPKATRSEKSNTTDTENALSVMTLIKTLEKMQRQLKDRFARRHPGWQPKIPFDARFANGIEKVLSESRSVWIRSQLDSLLMRQPGHIKPTSQVTRLLWENARTIDLGQSTKPVELLPRGQWPKPAQQLVEPPSWETFLRLFKQPVKQVLEEPVDEPTSGRIEDAEQQAAESNVDIPVDTAITDPSLKPLDRVAQQPTDDTYDQGNTELVQLADKEPLKTPERSSNRDGAPQVANTQYQQTAETPSMQPTILLQNGTETEKVVDRESTKQHSRKSPAQRRVERRLSKKAVAQAVPQSN